jgi:regulatory protein
MAEVTGRKKREPAKSRPVTASYLRNSAMHYLSARAASVAMLRQTLERRAKRRMAVRSLEPETKALIETAIADLVALGLINDAKFAENRAASLARKGFSKRRIGFGLKLKGIAAETIETAIAPDVDDLTQARLFVERKRLGRFRRGGALPETRDKDLRALARAGFGYGVAAKALDAPDDE